MTFTLPNGIKIEDVTIADLPEVLRFAAPGSVAKTAPASERHPAPPPAARRPKNPILPEFKNDYDPGRRFRSTVLRVFRLVHARLPKGISSGEIQRELPCGPSCAADALNTLRIVNAIRTTGRTNTAIVNPAECERLLRESKVTSYDVRDRKNGKERPWPAS